MSLIEPHLDVTVYTDLFLVLKSFSLLLVSFKKMQSCHLIFVPAVAGLPPHEHSESQFSFCITDSRAHCMRSAWFLFVSSPH